MEQIMTDKLLIEKGYKEFAPSPFCDEYIIKFFQKRFDDEWGKKYFINVNKYDLTNIDTNNSPYEFEIYLTVIGGDAIRLLLYGSNWDIDKVEIYIDNLFNTGVYEYYELWEEK